MTNRVNPPPIMADQRVPFVYQDWFRQVWLALKLDPETITTTTTLSRLNDIVLADATAGSITLTLELANTNPGQVHYIKKVDATANTVTIIGQAGETIDGAASQTLVAQYDALILISDGQNWFLFAGFPISGGGGGGGTTINSGSTSINFGAFPGTSETSVAVAAPTILAGSKAWAYFRADSTSVDHTADDHKYAASLISLTCTVTAGVGLTIYARCLDKMQGNFTIYYGWFN